MRDQSNKPLHHEQTLYHGATPYNKMQVLDQSKCQFKHLSIFRKDGNVLFNDALKHILFTGICHHMGYSFWLAARVLLYASSHRQDNTYHSLCYTSRGAQARMRNSSMGPPHEGSIRRPIAPWANALTMNYISLRGIFRWLFELSTQQRWFSYVLPFLKGITLGVFFHISLINLLL